MNKVNPIKNNPTIPVFNQDGKKQAGIAVPTVFQVDLRQKLVRQVLLAAMSRLEKVTSSTKTRGQRRGGGIKPWRQKGTGRARAGSVRSPIFRKGGITFGPTLARNPVRKISRRSKIEAVRSLIAQKIRDQEVIILSELKISEPKTKIMATMLETLPVEDTIYLVVDKLTSEIKKSGRNLPYLTLTDTIGMNILKLATNHYILLTKKSFNEIIKKLSIAKEAKEQ